MSKWVAITGGTGFIGSEIVRVLKGQGYKIRALVRGQSREKLNKQQVEEIVNGDLFEDKALRDLVRDVDFIVNCAGNVRGISRSSFFLDSNVYGLSNLLNHARKFSPEARLLHISSIAAKKPRVSPYAFSKWRGEEVLKQKGPRHWTIFRPPIVYGWGDKEVVVLLKIAQFGFFPIVGKGYNRFSMLHVRDLANAVFTWMECENGSNKIYELDDGKVKGYSWKELVRNMSSMYNKKIRLVPVPARLLYGSACVNIGLHAMLGKAPMFSPGKVRELLQVDWTSESFDFVKDTGWHPEIGLKYGLWNQ